MDIFLLVMPSILFVLLQYKHTTYSRGVEFIESIKEDVEKYLEKNSVREKTQQDNELTSNIDFILLSANKRESTGPWLIFGFAFYLLLIAFFHILGMFELYMLGSKDSQGINSQGIDSQGIVLMLVPRLMLLHMLCLVYMFILVCATLCQVYALFSKEGEMKKFSKSYHVVKFYSENASSSGKGVPDDLQ